MPEEIEGFVETPEEQVFLAIMFTTWTPDEMAYMHQRVMHPSYGKDVEESS